MSTNVEIIRERLRMRPLRLPLVAVALIVYFVPSLLLALMNRRLIQLTNPDRIGHLVGEVDCILKEGRLGLQPDYKGILLAPRNRVANNRIVDYWAGHVSVIRSPLLCRLLDPMCRFRHARFREDMACYLAAVDQTARYAEVQRLWDERSPLLELTEYDVTRGREALAKLDVPPDAQFVCFHSREGGYSPSDEDWHSFRNSNVYNYLGAARALVKRGLYCIRMGDPTTRPLPKMPGVIDYAHSDVRSEWMDVFLCARCLWFLGNTSGLFYLASAFGRPAALANLVPFSTVLSYGPRDIGIPMLLWSEREGRHLSFKEILESPVSNFRFTRLYLEHGIRPLESAAEDIRDLALEMLDRVNGNVIYTPEDERRQLRFKALMRPGHHGFGSAGRVGRDFLRKYAHLLGD